VRLRTFEISATTSPNAAKPFADFAAQGDSEIWNIQISDQVTAPIIRQTIKRGHGKM
jgi:hypothetical protein